MNAGDGGSGATAKFFLGQLAEMQEKNWVVTPTDVLTVTTLNCSTPDSDSKQHCTRHVRD